MRKSRAPTPARSEWRTSSWAGAPPLAGPWRVTGERERPLWRDEAAPLAKAGIADFGGTRKRLYANRFVEDTAR